MRVPPTPRSRTDDEADRLLRGWWLTPMAILSALLWGAAAVVVLRWIA